jgi:ADP-ribosylglycohydrolase
MLSSQNLIQTIKTQSLGLFYGLCLGDSLGSRTEFLQQKDILSRFGISGIQDPANPALLTDDSQLTIALAKALCNANLFDNLSIQNSIAKEFKAWRLAPDTPDRFPGRACLEACDRLIRGIPADKSGGPDELGAGAAMRASVVGFLFQNHTQRLLEVAALQAKVTHDSSEAVASSQAAALLVKFALDGMDPVWMISEIADAVMPACIKTSTYIRDIRSVLSANDTNYAMGQLGNGFLGKEAITLALYCMIKNSSSWIGTVRMAANFSGDSDTIACIAGGAQALRLGLQEIPPQWIERLERRDEITQVANMLAEKKLALSS